MKSSRIVLWALAATVASTIQAAAAPVTVSSLSAPLAVGSSNLATIGTAANSWTMSSRSPRWGRSVLQFSDSDGMPLANGIAGFSSGSWLSTTITNNSGSDWTSFEFELQKALGTASNELDGLSFAQRANLVFSSSAFSTVSRVDLSRDYLNFSGGRVASGASVTFLFAITDMMPATNPFYLVETANRKDLIIQAAEVPEPGTLGAVRHGPGRFPGASSPPISSLPPGRRPGGARPRLSQHRPPSPPLTCFFGQRCSLIRLGHSRSLKPLGRSCRFLKTHAGATLARRHDEVLAHALLDDRCCSSGLPARVSGHLGHREAQGGLPTMTLSKSTLTFGALTSGSAFAAQTSAQPVRVTQSGAGAVTWTATPSQPWLVVTPSAGSGSATLTVSVAASGGLPAAGTLNGR